MTTIERLRALLAEATPGPWRTQHTIDRDPEEYLAECVRLSYEYADSIGEPRQTRLHMAYAGDWDDERTPGGIITAMTGNGPTSERNAALIVAAVNALPALLDVVEALRWLTDSTGSANVVIHGGFEHGYDQRGECIACAALDRLDGAS